MKIKPTPCPHCGEILSEGMSRPGAVMKPDDIALCASCGGLCNCNEDFSMRKTTRADFMRLRDCPDVFGQVMLARAMILERHQVN